MGAVALLPTAACGREWRDTVPCRDEVFVPVSNTLCVPTSTRLLASLDANGDGVLDLVSASGLASSSSSSSSTTTASGSSLTTSDVQLNLLLGMPPASGGGYAPQSQVSSAVFGIAALASGDINADGLDDVVVGWNVGLRRSAASTTDASGSLAAFVGSHSSLTTDNGTVLLPLVTSASLVGRVTHLAVGNIDGVGSPEIVVRLARGEGQDSPADIVIVHAGAGGAGAAGAAAPVSVLDPVSRPTGGGGLVLVDLDGSGSLDIVVGDRLGLLVYANNAGSFSAATTASIITVPFTDVRAVVAADVNGDGAPDIVLAAQDASISWIANNGSGVLLPSLIGLSPGRSFTTAAIAAGDINGDGDVDVVASFDNDLGPDSFEWFANADSLGTAWSSQSVSSLVNTPGNVVLVDGDGDGDLDLALALAFDGAVGWYPNTDGAGSFGPVVVASMSLPFPTIVAAVDIDGDGDTDLVSGSYFDQTIVWLPNVNNGSGLFGSPIVVSTVADGVFSLAAADLDGDGDTDLVAALTESDSVVWYANDDGLGGSWSASLVSASVPRVSAVRLAHLDTNGRIDIVAASDFDDIVRWFPNVAPGGVFGPERVVGSVPGIAGLAAADLDGDGDIDLAASSPNDASLVWYANIDGAGNFTLQSPVVAADEASAGALVAADINGDGANDLVVASGARVSWFPSLPATPLAAFGLRRTVDTAAGGALALVVGDVDVDGDNDIVVGSNTGSGDLAVYLNLDGGGGAFTGQLTLSRGMFSLALALADLDGDGVPDLAATRDFENGLAWFSGTATYLALGQASHAVDTQIDADALDTADFDGDGALDIVVVSASTRSLAWYRNTLDRASVGTFGPPLPIDASALAQPVDVAAGDIDRDGDPDIVVGNFQDQNVVWYANTDGLGSFVSSPRTLADGLASPLNIALADLDADGALDVVVADAGNGVGWARNPGAPLVSGSSPWPWALVGPHPFPAWDVAVYDMDGDGDSDIVIAAELGRGVVWFANTDGAGAFTGSPPVNVSGTVHTTVLAVGDLDGDADADVIVGPANEFRLVWYANDGGSGVAWREHEVVDNMGGVPQRLAVGDVNGDAHLDIVVSTTANMVAWLLNTGAGPSSVAEFGPWQPVGLGQEAMAVGDMDADGDLDVVAVSNSVGELAWHATLRRTALADYPAVVRPLDTVHPEPCRVSGPFSLACVLANTARLPRCAQSTLILPPGTYGCSRAGRHGRITFPVTLAGTSPGSAAFNCSDKVLFRVETLRAGGPGGTLRLENITMMGMGVFEGDVASGAPGLRAEGSGSLLELVNVAVVGARAIQTPTSRLLDGGVGGAVLATDGASVSAVSTVFRACSSSSYGGALVGRGLGTSVTLRDTTVESCQTLLGGGGLALLGGARGTVQNGRAEFNTVSQGLGGALFVDAESSVVVDGTHIVGNRAPLGLGGGVLLRPGSNSTLTAATVTDNTALFGGGVAAVASSADTGMLVESPRQVRPGPAGLAAGGAELVLDACVVSGNTAAVGGGGAAVCGASVRVVGTGSTWAANTVAHVSQLGSSADLFVCPTPAGSPAGSPAVPWVTFEPSSGLSTAAADGLSVAGPPARLEWVAGQAPPAAVQLGTPLTGQFQVIDVTGRVVSYGVVTAAVEITPGHLIVPATRLEIATSQHANMFGNNVELWGDPERVAGLDAGATYGTVHVTVTLPVASGVVGAVPVAPLTASVEVGPCRVGSGYNVVDGLASGASSLQDVGTCSACAVGALSNEVSYRGCQPEPVCGARTVDVSRRLNSTHAVCVCAAGYTRSSSGSSGGRLECSPCPDGGVCPEGLGAPFPAPGYFPGATNGTFVACKRPAGCVGGAGAPCAPGYTGYMCNTCADGWYSNGLGECVKCPAAAAGAFAGAFLALCVVAAVGGLAIGAGIVGGAKVASSGARESGVSDVRQRTVPASVSMVFVVLQVLGILGEAKLGWSSGAQTALGVFNIANVDASVFASECALSSFHVKYAVSLLLPAVAMAMVLAVLMALKAAGAAGVRAGGMDALGPMRIKTLFDAVVFSVAPLLYIPMARSTFALFDCTRLPDGSFVVDADPGVACFDGPWWSVAWLGLLGLVGYVGGVPAYFMWCLMKRRHKLLDGTTMARYGSLYKLYRIPYYWGGVADLGKRLAIVVAAVFVSDSQLALIGLLLAVFLAALVLVNRARPYYYPLYNELDFRLSLILILVLLLGGASYAERNTAGGSDTAILVGVVLVLVALAVVAVHAVAVDMLQIVRSKQGAYSAVDDRSTRLAAELQREVGDVVTRAVELLGPGSGAPTSEIELQAV